MVEDRIAALEERVAALEGSGACRAAEGRVEPRPRRASGPDRRAAASPQPAARRHRRDAACPPSARRRATRASPSPRRGDAPAVAPGAPRARVPRGPAPAAPARDLEDFVGGSVLAWLGGVAVLAGLAFLLTIAISRGWIGEGARTALAGVLSLGLLGAGVWLRERAARRGLAGRGGGRHRRHASARSSSPARSTTSFPAPLALLGAFATGAVATCAGDPLARAGDGLARAARRAVGAGRARRVRRRRQVFLAIAYAATIAVLVWQRWTALGGLRLRQRDAAVGRVVRWPTRRRSARARRSSARSTAALRASASRPTAAACAGRDRPGGAHAHPPGSRVALLGLNAADPGRRRLVRRSTASRGSSRSPSRTSRSASPPPASRGSRASSRWSCSRSASCWPTSRSPRSPPACRW